MALRDQSEALDEVLLSLGALDGLEAVAQTIADGVRLLTDFVLVTLTAPTLDDIGTIVVASGGVAPTTPDDSGADTLPVRTYSLATARANDTTVPLLRLHGESPLCEEAYAAVLRRFAPHARLALDRARRFAAIKELAYTDPLTGLANLRGLQAALEREGMNARRTDRPLALLIIDLDDFRRYNSLWGHLVGDAALRYFARAIRGVARTGECVARVGGEEFAVLLPDVDERTAQTIAARIHEAIAEGSSGLPSPFTASIGIAVYPSDVPDTASLYGVADTAMTMAKKAGKNRTFHF